MTPKLKISSTDWSWDKIDPALTHIKWYGIKPINIDIINLSIGIFNTGDAKFKNQFGVIGTSLKNIK